MEKEVGTFSRQWWTWVRWASSAGNGNPSLSRISDQARCCSTRISWRRVGFLGVVLFMLRVQRVVAGLGRMLLTMTVITGPGHVTSFYIYWKRARHAQRQR